MKFILDNFTIEPHVFLNDNFNLSDTLFAYLLLSDYITSLRYTWSQTNEKKPDLQLVFDGLCDKW